MLKQRHETRLERPVVNVFAALLDVVARGRWGGATVVAGTLPPRTGLQYAQQRGNVFRRGKVLGCLRPVSLTLQETMLDPPCCVKLRLHWRIESPDDAVTHVSLDVRYSLNGAATLRRKHWRGRIDGHCARMVGSIERQLNAVDDAVAATSEARSSNTRDSLTGLLLVRARV